MNIRNLLITSIITILIMIPMELAYADDTVVYDAASFSNLSGRTKAEVMQKYTEAEAQGKTYVNGGQSFYYDGEQASTRAPYAAGTLSGDTLKAMAGMSNFYRWLIGVNDLSVNTKSNRSLQCQALDRNFEWNHYISNSSKPSDMDDALWQEGFECDHNILALNSTPQEAITSWMNEGYDPYESDPEKMWDTVGHRRAILDAAYSNIQYGYSGRIAIGKCGARTNSFNNAFAAFPAAGYMPSTLVTWHKASWTVELNTSIVKVTDASNVAVTVENLNTGESYVCTSANNKAKLSSNLLNFVQPMLQSGSYYTDSYKVTATGLVDVATGNPAEITYTVDFFDPNEIVRVSLERVRYAYTGEEIKPVATVYGTGSTVLTENTDYTLEYHNNIEEGVGFVIAKGKNSYSGTRKWTFLIEEDRKDISQSEISVTSTYPYRGYAVEPEVTVVHFGKTLEKDKDYEVVYTDNIDVGTAHVTITGKGDYTGSQEKTFYIYQVSQSVTTKLDQNPIELGGTAKLTATALGGADITFTSSDESVATIDPDGTIHALSNGSTTITVNVAETRNYRSATRKVSVTVSADVHTMEEIDIQYADENNNIAKVTKKCKVCGKEETTEITCMDSFSLWYYKGYNGYSYINNVQNEGAEYWVGMRSFRPNDADQTLMLESSDPSICEVDGTTFKFVGTGDVTLTIYAKYRPNLKIVINFKVSHVLDEGNVTKVPTCAEKGVKKYTCTVCGETVTEELEKDPENHVGGTHLLHKKEETCGEDGYSGDDCCIGCDEVFVEGHVIPATGNHTYDSGTVTTEPTCVDKGVKKFVCEVCGDSYTEDVPATGVHTWKDEYEVDKQATCTDKGSESRHCSVCDVINEYSIRAIDLIPHLYSDWVTTNYATCTEAGSKERTCSMCHGVENETIPALGHDIKLIAASEPTCTTAGNAEHYRCDRCGELFEDKDGTTKLEESAVVIPATGHSYGAWESISDEQHQRVCEHDAQHIEKAAHTWDAGVVTKKATEAETGLKIFTCTVCGGTKEEVIPMIKPDPVKQNGEDGTPTGKGASYEAANAAITGLKKDADPAGSKVAPLFVRSIKQTKKSLVLTWKRPAGAKTFVIYGNQCGKTKKIKKIMTTSKTKVTVKKAVKKITKGKYYKFIVVSLDKNKKVVSTSKMIHVATKGGKVGNFKKVTTKAKKNKVTLAKGKTFKLAGKGVPQSKKLKVKAHVGIRYESANTAVATVNKKGIIKAIKKGTTYIYAYSQNGTYAKIKVTVK